MTEVPTEALDRDALARWMAGHVESANGGPIQAEIVAGGRSNLTFFVSQGGHDWVLRRPPLGVLLPSAHDMLREYTVLKALQDSEVPVPAVRALCKDPEIIGAPFYIMDRVRGQILRDDGDTSGLSLQQRDELSRQLIDVLARIHAVDLPAAGLEGFGRPDGFVGRQVRRWTQHWERSKTREMPAMDRLAEHLAATLPTRSTNALVHGDYRLDNVLFEVRPKLGPTAVLDWEMSTLGDPLADLGLLMVYWPDPADPHPPPSVAPQLSGLPGFLTRREMAEAYSNRTGSDLRELSFYVVLGYFKLAIILEGIHRRYIEGRTLGDGFDQLGAEVPKLVDRAWEALAEGGKPASAPATTVDPP